MLHVRKNRSGRNIYPRYVRPGKEFDGDPAEAGYPSSEEAPYRYFHTVHTVTVNRREDVGSVFAFGDRSLILRTVYDRKAVLVENPTTGRHLFIPRKNILMFFWDQLRQFAVAQTWNRSEIQQPGSVISALESPKSRGMHHDVHAVFRARGGNPALKSEFKPPRHRPVRLTKPLIKS